MLRDDQIDSVIAIFIPPLVTDPVEVASAVAEAARAVPDKPVLGVFMRAEGAPTTLAPIPCYAFPESAALALARVATYGEWRARPLEAAPRLDRFDRGGVRQIVERVLARGGGWTTADEGTALLTAAGIRVCRIGHGHDVRRGTAVGRCDWLPRRPQGARTGALAQDRAPGRQR